MFWFQATGGAIPPLVPSPLKVVAWKMILGFAGLELALMKWMPGAEFKAMPTPTGHVPVYTVPLQCVLPVFLRVFGSRFLRRVLQFRLALPFTEVDTVGASTALHPQLFFCSHVYSLILLAFCLYPAQANGMQCYSATLLLMFGAMYYKQVINPASSIDPSLVYDEFGSLLSAVSLFAFLFCFGLVVKGYNAPSGRDGGKTGSLIVDFYWGTELYPRVFGYGLGIGKGTTRSAAAMLTTSRWPKLFNFEILRPFTIYRAMDFMPSFAFSPSLFFAPSPTGGT